MYAYAWSGRCVQSKGWGKLLSVEADRFVSSDLQRGGGETVRIRAGVIADYEAVERLHLRCSKSSLYARYNGSRDRLTAAQWGYFCDADRGVTMVAVPDEDPGRVVAFGNLMRTPSEGVAELALLVEDSWQGKGVATRLADQLLTAAHRLGFREVETWSIALNPPARAVLQRLGAELTRKDGEDHGRLMLPAAGIEEGATR